MVVADLANIHVKVVCVTKDQLEDKEFKAKMAYGFPFLETNEGIIFETVAIMSYFARCSPYSGLLG